MMSFVYLHIGELYSIFHLSDVSSLCHLQNAIYRRFGIPIKSQIICHEHVILTNLLYFKLYLDHHSSNGDGYSSNENTIHLVLLGKDHPTTVNQRRCETLTMKKSFLIQTKVNSVLEYEPKISSNVKDAIDLYLFHKLQHHGEQNEDEKYILLYRDIIILHPLCLLIDLVLDLKNIEQQEELILDVITKFPEQFLDRSFFNCDKDMDFQAKIDSLHSQIRESLIPNFYLNPPISDDRIAIDNTTTSFHGNPSVFKYTINDNSSFVVLLYKGSTIFENLSNAYINEVYVSKLKDKTILIAKSSKEHIVPGDESIPQEVTVQFLTFQITINLGEEQEMKNIYCIKRYIWKLKGIPMIFLKLYHEKVELENYMKLSALFWKVNKVTLNGIVDKKPNRVVLNLFGVRGIEGELLFRDRKVGMLGTETIQDLKDKISNEYDVLASKLVIEDAKYSDSCQIWETESTDFHVAWNGSYVQIIFPVNNQENKKCTIL